MLMKVHRKGQVVIPAEIRRKLGKEHARGRRLPSEDRMAEGLRRKLLEGG